ncbi:protease pro-enzyme activation domain-containing protein [Geomesophilobacter sediminis]|uniref:Peptidase S53 domain-containing protein n=1 Tax=Geomesophilobacter sediminis TaxID=2798584 RepID=A0A8J7JB51_9BACT|nr:protease pro-enzyme activation domain-containing protein [Geomesophilobacter sediminis]MBJ6724296.1 hypothetical protein [Geomesophilobacter sediminis]
MFKTSQLAVAALICLGLVVAPAFAGGDRIINDRDTVILHGNVHPQARPENDAGPADPALPMERMILTLRLPPDRQSELDKFLARQQDPASPDFHRWLAPEEFRARFAPDPADVASAERWLAGQGFVIDEIGKGGTWINFSGPVAAVERAFHTRIRRYRDGAGIRQGNADEPSIPAGLADLVAGIVSLHNFPRRPMHTNLRTAPQGSPLPAFTSGSTHYLAPADFATIYNVNPLYAKGLSGTGQSIAIVGRTHPPASNWSTFRATMGLPANPPVVVVNGADPGDLGGGEDNEADLDVEWSGAVARDATILFVTSKSTTTTDGVDLSAQYIVNNNLAPVMSTSFGQCEAQLGRTERTFYNNLWQQAAAQGITSFVSSGDAGAAGCNAGSDSTGSGSAVNGLASTPYNVAVGGTQFSEGVGSYWSANNGTGYGSALGYIPEVAWNESGSVSGGTGLWSTGGGVSAYFAKPSWQSAPGVPADGKRDVPDVSLSAAGHDGYLVQTQNALYVIGGTSASSPAFAGLMALVVQGTGQRQGNPNQRLYQLAAAQFSGTGVGIFHDTTSGNNSVPGVPGYASAAGYDLATGLGSVDAAQLVTNWIPDFALAAAPVTLTIPQRSSATTTVTSTVYGNFNSAVALSATSLPAGVTAGFAPSSITAPGAGSSLLTLSVAATTVPGSYQVLLTGSGGANTHTIPVSITVVPVYDLTASVAGNTGGTIAPASVAVAAGGSASFTVTPAAGYALATLTDNGTDVTGAVSGGVYTVSGVAGPHSIVAGFTPIVFPVQVSVTGGGSVTPTAATVSYGGSITFTLTPAEGFRIAGVTDNGVAVNWTESPPGAFSYRIDNVTAPHDVAVTFQAIPAVPALPPHAVSLLLVAAVLGACSLRRKTKP